MIFSNLTVEHDFTFGAGKGNYLSENAAIELNIKTRCLEVLGDCFFAMNSGIDYNNLLEHNQKSNLDIALRVIILASYGVIRINSTNITVVNRTFTFDYNIDTIYSSGFKSQISG